MWGAKVVTLRPVAAPTYVPQPAIDPARTYRGPQRRLGSWTADRPGELAGPQPSGGRFGHQGPDQGYALALVDRLVDGFRLTDGEHLADARAAAVAVALKRASIFGRAPVMDDVVIGATVWGLLDETPDAALVDRRRSLHAEAGLADHEPRRRAIADAVPESTLRMAAVDVTDTYARDWASLLAD